MPYYHKFPIMWRKEGTTPMEGMPDNPTPEDYWEDTIYLDIRRIIGYYASRVDPERFSILIIELDDDRMINMPVDKLHIFLENNQGADIFKIKIN